MFGHGAFAEAPFSAVPGGDVVTGASFAVAGVATLSFVGTEIVARTISVTGVGAVSPAAAGIWHREFAISGVGTVSPLGAEVLGETLAISGVGAFSGPAAPVLGQELSIEGVAVTAFLATAPTVTSTEILQKPVDYALAGEQLIKDRYREFDLRARNMVEKTTVASRGLRRLKGAKPGFVTRTDSRGYD